jgi:hypothetical protein
VSEEPHADSARFPDDPDRPSPDAADGRLDPGQLGTGDMDLTAFRRHGHEVVDWIADYLDSIGELPVRSPVAPGEVSGKLPTSPVKLRDEDGRSGAACCDNAGLTDRPCPDDQDTVSRCLLVTGNRVRDSNNGLYTGVIFGQDTDPAVTGGIGNVFRGNRVEGMSRAGIVVDTWNTRGGTVSSTVFEKNEIMDVQRGFLSGLQILWWARGEPVATPAVGTQISAAVLRENRFTRGPAEGAGVGFFAAARQVIQSQDNRREGFVAPSAARE